MAGDDILDRLVADANPVTDATLEQAGLTEAFDRVGERIVANTQRPLRRPMRRRGGVALVLVAAAVVTSVAVGGMYGTHTGFFPATAGTENDTSEFLDATAPDFPPLAEKLVSDIPFPPGDSAVSRVPRYVAQMKANQAKDGGGPETVQAAGIKGTFSLWAVCAWRGYWLQAHREGSQAKEAMAADGLAKVASSEAMKKADTWWPVYLNVAKNEAAGDPSAPSNFEGFYQGNCVSQPQPWAGK